MRETIQSIEAEYRRYRLLGEGALGQVEDGDLGRAPVASDNSLAILVQHLGGNLESRFTDFLTSDGEKPWRDRDAEFAVHAVSRQDLNARWDRGWAALFNALAGLSDEDLPRSVTIRGQPLSVREALHRSLAHASYHVGQIVLLAKSFRGAQWRSLSIPPGGSAAYNQQPTREKAPRPVPTLQDDIAERIERALTGPVWHGPALAELLAGVSAAEATAAPAAGLHSIAVLVRHLIFWVEDPIARLSGRAPADQGPNADWPPVADLDEPSWRQMTDTLAVRHRELAQQVRGLSLARLAERVPGKKVSFEDIVRGAVEHAAYHGGQIAILLRSLRAKSTG